MCFLFGISCQYQLVVFSFQSDRPVIPIKFHTMETQLFFHYTRQLWELGSSITFTLFTIHIKTIYIKFTEALFLQFKIDRLNLTVSAGKDFEVPKNLLNKKIGTNTVINNDVLVPVKFRNNFQRLLLSFLKGWFDKHATFILFVWICLSFPELN